MKKVWIVVAILVVVVGVAAYLNMGDLGAKKDSQDNAVFSIVSGQDTVKVDMNMVKGLEKTDFDANIKSSGKAAEKHVFTGVSMKKVFEAANIKTVGKTKVIVKAVDGYTSAITMDEAMEENNIYIVYAMDGKPLGKREDGGAGPFEMVIKNDPFSQRWCKYVTEVELQ